MSLTKVSYSMIAGGYVSILDYGAKSGGNENVAANDAAFAAAIATGKTVYVPSGSFYVTGIDNTGVSMFGDGPLSTFIFMSSSAPKANSIMKMNYPAFEKRNLFVRDIAFFGYNNGGGSTGHGIDFTGAFNFNFVLYNCKVGNPSGSGYAIYSNNRGLGGSAIENCLIDGGIYCRTLSDGLTIRKNIFLTYSRFCVDLEIEPGSYQTDIRDNFLIGDSGSIKIIAGSQILIENNQMEQLTGTTNTTPESALVYINGNSGRNVTRVTFRNNNFGGAAFGVMNYSCWINNCEQVNIINNRLNNSTLAHIEIGANAVDTTVFENWFDFGSAPATAAAQIVINDNGFGTVIRQNREGNYAIGGGNSNKWPTSTFGKTWTWGVKGTTPASARLLNDDGELNWLTSAGAGFIGSVNGVSISEVIGNGKAVTVGSGSGLAGGLYPESDNLQTLGYAGHKWSTVWAGTGTIQTSDETAKTIKTDGIDPAVLRAWGKVNFAQYKFNDAIAEKGEQNARWHFGVIAQHVKDAFESEGLDPFAYGVLCYDEWKAEPAVFDDQGNVLRQQVKAGSSYAIRYDEAFALECAYLRSKLT